jgi:hypothetical protein
VAGACATVATVECAADDDCIRGNPCTPSQCVTGHEYQGVPYRACVTLACLPSTDERLRACFGESLTNTIDLPSCLGRRKARQFERALRDFGRLIARAKNLRHVAACPYPFADFSCDRHGATGKRAIRWAKRAAALIGRLSEQAERRATSGACGREITDALAVRGAMIVDALTNAECGGAG